MLPQKLPLNLKKILERYTDGPIDGVFTDGACSGNPGPGGWAAVFVKNNEIIEFKYGHEPHTTNNKMELTALIASYKMLPTDLEITVWSDSQLCVSTINEWAKKWEQNGWRKKGGPIKNLELIQELYSLANTHPKVKLQWIKAHNGFRWNEVADAVANLYLEEK